MALKYVYLGKGEHIPRVYVCLRSGPSAVPTAVLQQSKNIKHLFMCCPPSHPEF